MGKIWDFRAYVMKFYAKYSRVIDIILRFLLAILTFSYIGHNIGQVEVLTSPVVLIGIAIICVFLPVNMTVIFAAIMVLIQLSAIETSAALVTAIIMIIMFALYFRFASDKALILLLTPLAFWLKIPILIPIVFGMLSGPACAIPIAFGVMIRYIVTYAKSYSIMIETVEESGTMAQVTSFVQALVADKEMWLVLISFTICFLFVYNVRRLAIDYAHEIAVVAGVLAHIIMMTFGFVMMDVEVSYVELIISGIIAVFLAIFLKMFVISVDYTRSEYLQFEDDEYYYYVKAVPKISVEVPKKTVKTINTRQKTEGIDTDEVNNVLRESQMAQKSLQARRKSEMEQSEIQKIIEEELKR